MNQKKFELGIDYDDMSENVTLQLGKHEMGNSNKNINNSLILKLIVALRENRKRMKTIHSLRKENVNHRLYHKRD